MFYVAVVGSRDYPYIEDVVNFVNQLPPDCVVVSGGARGVDAKAVETARQHGLKTIVYPADWKTYGKAAGYIRNQNIINRADVIVSFWDGKSRGTAHSMDLALAAGKPLYCQLYWLETLQLVS